MVSNENERQRKTSEVVAGPHDGLRMAANAAEAAGDPATEEQETQQCRIEGEQPERDQEFSTRCARMA
jgi:hypothetical protein